MKRPFTVVFALCGSFCTFEKALPQAAALVGRGIEVIPLMSFNAAGLDTRFGRAQGWKEQLQALTGRPVIETLQGAEPLGPKGMADAMIVAPCTGCTLAKLDLGISDTPVTLGVKSMLRADKPILLALSTNDGMGASGPHIAALSQRRNFYMVPFGQDAPGEKPASLQSDFSLIGPALEAALEGKKLQPQIVF